MQPVTKCIRKGKRYVHVSRAHMRDMKRMAHQRIRTHLRMAIARNDWDLVKHPTVGQWALTSWEIS